MQVDDKPLHVRYAELQERARQLNERAVKAERELGEARSKLGLIGGLCEVYLENRIQPDRTVLDIEKVVYGEGGESNQ